MAKTKISEFSATPGNNTDIDSINIAEGCAPSGINDAIRELMAQLKDFQTGAVGDSFNGPVGTTTAAAGAFTTLAASGAVTLSGGTANGVTYLNGSKVLTSGSSLVFDGTNLGIGTSSPIQVGKLSLSYDSNTQRGLVISASLTSLTDQIGFVNPNGLVGSIATSGTSLVLTTAATERMRLDQSGNLGLGVTPSAWSIGKVIEVGNAGSTVYSGGQADMNLTSNAYYNGGWKYGGTGAASWFSANNNTFKWYTAPSGTAGAAISFTQAMTLDASGNLLVGTTSGNTKIYIKGSNGNQLTLDNAGETYTQLFFNNNGAIKSDMYFENSTTRFYVRCNSSGGVYLASGATSWTASSDERKKDIIEPITDAAVKVSTLRAVIGKYKTDEEGVRRSFLIAQDVQAVLPEAVDATTPDDLGVQYADVIPLLVAAIKEQQALIQSLQADVAALKAAA